MNDGEPDHVSLNTNNSSSQPKARADVTPPDSLWEVRLSPGKGRGVFATRRIAAGTQIHAEDPLFSIQPPEFQPGRGFRVDEVISAVNKAVASLPEEEQAEFYACHEHREPHETSNDAQQRNLFILRSNAYMLPSGRSAMFPRLARVNHSCRPNAAHLWNPAARGDRVDWVAARDIEAGEEITVTYVNLLMTAAERQQRLAQYGFTCDCAACVGQGETDSRRARMGVLLLTLNENPEGRGNDGIAALGENLQLLRWAEELVQMLEEEALVDYLPQAYGYAGKLSSVLGDDEAAVDWRRKEAEVLSI